jgi:hypothetical protein
LTSRTVSPRNHVEVDVTNNPKWGDGK